MASYTTPNKPRFQGGIDTYTGQPVDNKDSGSDFEKDVGKAFDELKALLLKKHKDYGPKNISDAPGGAINGLRVRMHDKLARINNIYDSTDDLSPENEPFEDSFIDMANYAVIGLLVLRDKWDK